MTRGSHVLYLLWQRPKCLIILVNPPVSKESSQLLLGQVPKSTRGSRVEGRTPTAELLLPQLSSVSLERAGGDPTHPPPSQQGQGQRPLVVKPERGYGRPSKPLAPWLCPPGEALGSEEDPRLVTTHRVLAGSGMARNWTLLECPTGKRCLCPPNIQVHKSYVHEVFKWSGCT